VIRVTVQLPEEQLDAARTQARLEGLSLARYVRQALDAELVRSEARVRLLRRRALTAVDKVDFGPPAGAVSAGARPGSGEAGVPRYWIDDPLDDE